MNCLWKRVSRPLIYQLKLQYENRTICSRSVSVSKYINCNNYIFTKLVKPVQYSLIRCKSKKAPDSDDEEEDYGDDKSLSKDSKIVKFNSTSLRTDLVLKSALGIARNKIEQSFYESRIRVNGKKIMKKSVSVRIGDEVDIVKMVSPKNPDHLYVYRVEVLNIAAKEESIAITARRFKNLLIENYEEDPYKGNDTVET